MKNLFLFITLCSMLLSFKATEKGETRNFVEGFEEGYRYVIDNQGDFSNAKSPIDIVTIMNNAFHENVEIQHFSLGDAINDSNFEVSADLRNLLQTLNNGISGANSYEDFLGSLNTFETSISQARLSQAETANATQYAQNFRNLMEITRNELQFYNGFSADFEGDLVGWWQSWGKCAAAITGGVLTGGLAGAWMGSAAPVIGTVAGGIVGAIGGGLTGASAGCD